MVNSWKQNTLEYLEKKLWPDLRLDEASYLIRTCNTLRKKKLEEFTTEDLRIMIGQGIGLPYLLPMAIETLKKDLFAEGDYYEGDLLKSVLHIEIAFWDDNEDYWQGIDSLIKSHREEIARVKIDISRFDSCKHSKRKEEE